MAEWPTDPTDIIREALREYVGDGDGADEAVLAAHDAEVAANALEDAAGAALSETKDKLLPGVVGALWLRSRAAEIRARGQS